MFHSSLPVIVLFTASVIASPFSSITAREPAGEQIHVSPTHAKSSENKTNGANDTSYVALAWFGDKWYSFGTSNGKDVQGASSGKLEGLWERLEGPILAIEEATWAGLQATYGIWAPDIYQRSSDKKFVMYFSAFDKEKKDHRCIGAAISDDAKGVYHPQSDFVQCNRTSSGAIDPAWFKDTDGKQYVVYKTEIPENWLELREVRSSGPKEGVEWSGNARKLLQMGSQGFDDGGNMEAPYIFKRGDTYFLTYSTHITMNGSYDVQYATAKNVMGPYTRVKKPLLKTSNEFGCKLIGPGGASFQRDDGDNNSTKIIFHGLTEEVSIEKRVVYTANVQVDGDRLSITSASA